MKHHRLTGTELNVSCFCQGAAPFGTVVRDAPMRQLYDLFRAAGGNFFDTAHCYSYWIKDGLGTSERALGECLRSSGDRAQVVVATKGGHHSGTGYPKPDAYLAAPVIAREIQESLERLAIDRIDLYYLHRDDPRMPVGEIIDTLNAEIERGRLRYLGASNWTTARIEAANTYAATHGLQGFVASQPLWNLAHPNPFSDPTQHALNTADEEQWYQRHQLAVVPYSPTACGFFASGGERAKAAFDNHISRARLERAEHLAVEMRVTPNQIALAWLLSHPFPVIPILGTTQPDHLTEALRAESIQLSPEQVRWLRG